MKLFSLLLLLMLTAACKKQSYVAFTGTAKGIKNGVFMVKTLGDSSVFGENIKDGKFTIAQKTLNHPGYYKMNITDADHPDGHNPFEVYLENGDYTIETAAGKLYKYPKISSPSKIQEQLSAFYILADDRSVETLQAVNQINKELKEKYRSLSPEAYNNLLGKLQENEAKLRDVDAIAFKQFLKQYPQSEISAHLLSKLDYAADPVKYAEIFKTLSPAAKNSDEGREIGERLGRLVKLVAGMRAPAINGKTPDGKTFDPRNINKKLVLVDFWRAGNEFSRQNHQQIMNLQGQDDVRKNVAFISVSLDSKADWWTTALKDDHLTWTQVADLKGDDSPNAANWNITEIPTYYLLDGKWNIIVPNIELKTVALEISEYLKKHR
ncbi:MAG: TlpA family protein disulfide reductase [Mucilaginibacter sp.]